MGQNVLFCGHFSNLRRTLPCLTFMKEVHLALGWVHVDIDVLGGHLNRQVDERVGVVWQDLTVNRLHCLLDLGGEGTARVAVKDTGQGKAGRARVRVRARDRARARVGIGARARVRARVGVDPLTDTLSTSRWLMKRMHAARFAE